jgi:F-type H+-transporting ATPase subunit c
MEAEAAKYIGAGLACFGMAGTALGLGNIFGQLPLRRSAQPVRC